MGEEYVNIILRMEPQHTTVDDELRALTSIAISLKRIADSLTLAPVQMPGFDELPPDGKKLLRNLVADIFAGNLTCPVCNNKYKDHNAFIDNPCPTKV